MTSNNKFFSVLQNVGRSFMLPIALLPIAGLLLGIGASFTNPQMLSSMGLLNTMGEGTIWYSIFTLMSQVGNIVFANLPIIFALELYLFLLLFLLCTKLFRFYLV